MISAGGEEKVFLWFTMWGGIEGAVGGGMNFCGILELLHGVRFLGVVGEEWI